MADSHCIDSLQFEVDFDTAEHAFEEQNRVAAFARARAPKIIDEVFDQFSQAGQVWRFATLEIDLGPIEADALEQQWEARLRERLAQALQEQQAALSGLTLRQRGRTEAPLPAQQHSREQAQLDTLLYFLQHGHLPWHTPQAQALASPIEQLAHEVLRDSAAGLVAAWRESPAAQTMVQRAARQFSPAWLARLARALARSLGVGEAAGWGREAEAWVQGFVTLWGESRLPSAPPPHLLWQGLLTALWADAGVVDRSQPLHSMVQAVAPSVGEQTSIWRALQAVARRAVDGTPPAPTATLSDELLRTCLAAQLPALADTGATKNEQVAASRSDELARLQLRLHAWFDPHAPNSDNAPWLELLRAEPSWARHTLLLLGRSAPARRRLAQALPPTTLFALTALWLGPTEQSLLQAALPNTALWGHGSAALEPTQRWELTLSHLLLHPAPALFNATDYLDDMLQQRSERENRPRASLLRELAEAWQVGQQRDPPPHTLMMAWVHSRLRAEPLELSPTALRRARLEASLAQGLLTGAEDDWFEALRGDAIWLQELLRRIGRRPALLRRMARDWSTLPRLQLLGLWLQAADRAAVITAIHNPAFAVLAGVDETKPELYLWEDLLAHLLRLTPGTFFNADAYVRGLRERVALAAGSEPSAGLRYLRPNGTPSEPHGNLAHPLTPSAPPEPLTSSARPEPPTSSVLLEPPVFPVRTEPPASSVRPDPPVSSVRTEPPVSSVRTDPPASSVRPDPPVSVRPEVSKGSDGARPSPSIGEAPHNVIHIANAGMVLAGAYLERLFGMLGLADPEAFVSPEAAERAVHLLQYLATGNTGTPEPLLVLNKVLCGLPIGSPVLREFDITPQEAQAIDGLLQAMIGHWKILGHTSIAGLRESFLQREGRLSFDDEDGWQLQVEPRSFDMLLDPLPWGYSLQKLPWMKEALHVEWR